MLWFMLSFTVFLTSVLSGVLGMAGGMILMAILVTLLSVANAMILHGAVQATANGSRAWFLRSHIKWGLLPNYILGALGAVAVFSLIALVPNPGLVLFLVGIFPWLARYSRSLNGLDVTRPLTTIVCGFVVTAAQLLAGASGPLLDVFYLNSPLNRQEIVANKALTQTIGHLLKILYYGLIVAVATTLPWWLFVCAMTAAVAGTRVGTLVLHRWDDAAFARVSSVVILTIAGICMVRGIWVMWTSLPA
ncbi:MAG: sulfite exporter TauE/SafE family protein [Pseudomonadaceae bacterium]|nr:sulfite exporter TauE/SafE family protein [Pseudomonadaceae bacterium]